VGSKFSNVDFQVDSGSVAIIVTSD
jgi:hypothetical protein